MIIWIINPYDNLPGEDTRLGRYASLAKVLCDRGHEVHWWSSGYHHGRKSQRYFEKIDSSRVYIHLVPTSPYKKNISLGRVRNHRQLSRLFRTMANAAIISGELKPPDKMLVSVPPLSVMKSALILRQQFGGKVIFDIQDAWPEAFYQHVPSPLILRQKLGEFLFAMIRKQRNKRFQMADACTAVANGYLELAGINEIGKPCLAVPIGISLSERDKIGSVRKATQTEGMFRFIYLGSMASSYDLKTLVLAAKELSDAGYRFEIIIAGRGSQETELKRMTSIMGLDNIVLFPGYVSFSEVVLLLENATAGLNCLFPESYGFIQNKVGDYLGAGLPVINSVQGELYKLLINANAGIQYIAGDVSSLYKALKQCMDNIDLLNEQSKCARKLAEDMFNRDVTYLRFANFIENI